MYVDFDIDFIESCTDPHEIAKYLDEYTERVIKTNHNVYYALKFLSTTHRALALAIENRIYTMGVRPTKEQQNTFLAIMKNIASSGGLLYLASDYELTEDE